MTNEYAGIAANINIKAKAEIASYADAAEFLGDEDSRELASNVWVERAVGVSRDRAAIYVRLYKTRIVTYYSDETFSVRNGGYNTPTTSRRVTQFTPAGYIFFHHNKQLALLPNKKSAEDVRLPVERGN